MRVNDQQDRFLTQAFELSRTIYNATLDTALGQLKRMRENKERRETRSMPKDKERSQKFAACSEKSIVPVARTIRITMKTTGRSKRGL